VKRLLFVVPFLILTFAASAQSNRGNYEVIGRYLRIDPQGSTRFDEPSSLFRKKSGSGFGVEANVYVARSLSIDAGVGQADTRAWLDLGSGAAVIPLGSLQLRPITLAAQWHLAPRASFDLYAGAGAMYLMSGSFHDEALTDLGITRLDIDNKFAPMANAGVIYGITPSIAIDFDAKYSKIKASAHSRSAAGADTSEAFDVRLDPLVYSAGVRFRF